MSRQSSCARMSTGGAGAAVYLGAFLDRSRYRVSVNHGCYSNGFFRLWPGLRRAHLDFEGSIKILCSIAFHGGQSAVFGHELTGLPWAFRRLVRGLILKGKMNHEIGAVDHNTSMAYGP